MLPRLTLELDEIQLKQLRALGYAVPARLKAPPGVAQGRLAADSRPVRREIWCGVWRARRAQTILVRSAS
jgi:hypothetical protein